MEGDADENVTDETVFVVEEINQIIKQSIEHVIHGANYETEKVTRWTQELTEHTLREVSLLNKRFKYVVQCIITQKNGAGLHIGAANFWEDVSDGCTTVIWENAAMRCIVTVCGVAV